MGFAGMKFEGLAFVCGAVAVFGKDGLAICCCTFEGNHCVTALGHHGGLLWVFRGDEIGQLNQF